MKIEEFAKEKKMSSFDLWSHCFFFFFFFWEGRYKYLHCAYKIENKQDKIT